MCSAYSKCLLGRKLGIDVVRWLSHLTSVDTTAGVPRTQERVGNRLEVRLVTLLISPYRQLSLQLLGALAASVTGGPPTDDRGQSSLEGAVELITPWQANGDDVFWFLYVFWKELNSYNERLQLVNQPRAKQLKIQKVFISTLNYEYNQQLITWRVKKRKHVTINSFFNFPCQLTDVATGNKWLNSVAKIAQLARDCSKIRSKLFCVNWLGIGYELSALWLLISKSMSNVIYFNQITRITLERL